jgi:hypothetical protein
MSGTDKLRAQKNLSALSRSGLPKGYLYDKQKVCSNTRQKDKIKYKSVMQMHLYHSFEVLSGR